MNSTELAAIREVNEIARAVGDTGVAFDLADALKELDPDTQIEKSEKRLARSRSEVAGLKRDLAAANDRADAASAELVRVRKLWELKVQAEKDLPDVETVIRAADRRVAQAEAETRAAEARASQANIRTEMLLREQVQDKVTADAAMATAISKARVEVAAEMESLRRDTLRAEAQARQTRAYREQFDDLDYNEILKLEGIVKEARALKLGQKNFRDRGGNA